jgi:nucleotide-binding universal stress UspA family protein
MHEEEKPKMFERVASVTDESEQLAPTYLAGLDGSGPSVAALRWALHRADWYRANLAVVHVDEGERQSGAPSDAILGANFPGGSELIAATGVAAESYPDVPVTTRFAVGNASDELARLSRDSDLLVIGTHKTGYLRGRTIGARGIYVASHTDCSVAVIPDVSLVSRRGIVVGISPATGSPVALLAGAREAQRLNQPLILVSASPSRGVPAGRGDTLDSATGKEALSEAVGTATAMMPGLEVHSRLSSRPPAVALLDASRDASLLVLGAENEHDPTHSMIGPVTHDVLMNINVPVLIARAPRVSPDEVFETRSDAAFALQ